MKPQYSTGVTVQDPFSTTYMNWLTLPWHLTGGNYTIDGLRGLSIWQFEEYDRQPGGIVTYGCIAPVCTSSGDADSGTGSSAGSDTGDAVDGSVTPQCPNCVPYTGDPDEFLSTNDFVSNLVNSGGVRSLFKTGVSTVGKAVFNRAASTAPLKLLHARETLSKSSFDFWNKKATHEIIDSLKPGSPYGPLTVKPDGIIMNGNTRITILLERGIDVNALVRVPR